MNFKKFALDWIVPLACAALVTLLVHTFIFFNINVPTGSMFPTIKPGDRILVTRIYNKEKLQRGDIIVFHSDELGEDLIKRLVGKPGDAVEVNENGEVFINGEKQKQPYVVYGENRAGSFKVPQGQYLFFGDNRASSFDARKWKEAYIKEDKLMGKARFIIYPFSRAGTFKIGEEALKLGNKL